MEFGGTPSYIYSFLLLPSFGSFFRLLSRDRDRPLSAGSSGRLPRNRDRSRDYLGVHFNAIRNWLFATAVRHRYSPDGGTWLRFRAVEHSQECFSAVSGKWGGQGRDSVEPENSTEWQFRLRPYWVIYDMSWRINFVQCIGSGAGFEECNKGGCEWVGEIHHNKGILWKFTGFRCARRHLNWQRDALLKLLLLKDTWKLIRVIYRIDSKQAWLRAWLTSGRRAPLDG